MREADPLGRDAQGIDPGADELADGLVDGDSAHI